MFFSVKKLNRICIYERTFWKVVLFLDLSCSHENNFRNIL
jgi:hypothetical protein